MIKKKKLIQTYINASLKGQKVKVLQFEVQHLELGVLYLGV